MGVKLVIPGWFHQQIKTLPLRENENQKFFELSGELEMENGDSKEHLRMENLSFPLNVSV